MPKPLLTLALALAAFLQAAAQEELKGAHVPEDKKAAMLFDRALNVLRAGRHAEAAEKLVELQDGYADRLILFGESGQYVSTRQLVIRVTREMKPEALAAWRKSVDGRVDTRLEQARGPQDLRRVLRDYPMATRAPEAARRLAQSLWERGDAEGSALAWEEFLAMPGVAEEEKPDAVAAMALARGAMGDRIGVEALAARQADRMAQTVRIRGKAATLKAVFDAARKRLAGTGDGAPVWAQWPTFGGSPSRDRLAPGLKSVPAPSAQFELEPGAMRQVGRDWGGSSYEMNAQSREFMPVMPAVSDGLIVVNEGHQAWGAELVGGGARKIWSVDGGLPPSQLLFEERVLHGATIDRGRAYFSLAASCENEEKKLGWLVVIYPIPFRKLVCVEAQTGRVLWERGGKESGKTFLERASFHGAPAVDGDRLYCGVTYWATSTDIIEHHVVCLDARTGDPIWTTFVASGIQELNLFNNNTRESVCGSVTLTGRRLYHVTNIGVVGALDREDGGLLWARRYPRFAVEPVRDPYDIPRSPTVWANNPVLTSVDGEGRERVLVTPLDSPSLLCLSGEDGSVHWKFDQQGGRHTDARLRHMVTVREGIVYLTGREVVGLHVASGKNAFIPVAVESGLALGRGAVAADGIYVPTTTGVRRYGLRNPEEGRQFWPWPNRDPRTPGNLLLVDHALISAANENLTVFYDPDRAKAFFEAEIARNPESAYLRYRLALLFLQNGESERAEGCLKDALRKAEARDDDASRTIADACRRTLFRNLLSSAERLMRDDKPRQAAEELEKARAWAPEPAAWLELLFRQSDAWSSAGIPAKSAAALQEVIEKYGDALHERETGRSRAQRTLDALLRRHGRAPYDPFEKQASDLLARARAGSDAALFQEILRRFPNSLAAEEAAYGLGAARLAAGDWVASSEAMGRFLRDYPESALVAQALADLVISYEKRQLWGLSSGRLRRLKRSHGEAEVTVEGRRVKAGAWAEGRLATAAYRALVTGGEAPAVGFPAERRWSLELQPGIEARVLSPEGTCVWERARVIAVAGAIVAAADPASGNEAWRAEAPRGTRWAGWSGPLLVLAGDSAVHAYRENGEVAWKSALDGTILYCARESEGMLYISARNKQGTGSFLAAIDAATGAQAWHTPMQANHHLREFWVTEHGLAWRSRDDLGLMFAERETGRPEKRVAISASRLQQAGTDRFLATSGNGTIALVDAGTGKELWTFPQKGVRLDNALELRANFVSFATFEVDSWRLKVLDLENGKLLADVDTRETWLKQMACDGENTYLVFKARAEPNPFVARAYQCSTGKLLWEAVLEGGFQSMFPCVNSKDHLILNCPTFRKDAGQWTPVLIGLDKKTGKESGRIEGRPTATPTYAVEVAPGRVLLQQDDTVEAFGR